MSTFENADFQIVSKSFFIMYQLGSGSFGTVYRALDNGPLQRAVAIKLLHDRWVHDNVWRSRFLEEAKILAQHDWHPNIATVYDLIEEDDRIAIIMMLYPETLKDTIDRNDGVDWINATHFALQIVKGLCILHDNGVIHRDIKPSNILLDIDFTCKITDFGLASATRANGMTTGVGTVGYMAPEVASGQEYDHRADIYSLGVTWYTMLTGRTPIFGTKQLGPLSNHLQGNPMPDKLANILFKCLELEPDKRYPTCDALFDDLDNVSHEVGVG